MTILLVGNIANAQAYMYQRGLATLSVGVTSPSYAFGNYQGTELHSYVNLGTCITGEVAYFYSKNVGLNFLINYNVHTIDNNSLAESYLDLNPEYKTVTVQTNPFQELSGFTGFVFDIPPVEYFSFVFKLMVGLRNIHKPSASVQITTDNSTINYNETSDNSITFALYSSAGLRVVVNDHFNIHINASYVGSTYDFEFERNSAPVDMKDVHIGILSFVGGVSYSF